FRLRLRKWGLPEPHLDYDVYSAEGEFLGCSEFAYPDLKLAFEYEGDHHRTDTKQSNRDIEKYRAYVRHGWDPVRITSHMLYREPLQLRELVLGTFAARSRGIL